MANRACAEIGRRAIRDFRARRFKKEWRTDFDLCRLASPRLARFAPQEVLLHQQPTARFESRRKRRSYRRRPHKKTRAGRYVISTALPALQLVA
jgi:hypothetical protein